MDCPPRPSSWISFVTPAGSITPASAHAGRPACRARRGTPRLALERLEGQRHAHLSEGPAQIHAAFCHAGLATACGSLLPATASHSLNRTDAVDPPGSRTS